MTPARVTAAIMFTLISVVVALTLSQDRIEPSGETPLVVAPGLSTVAPTAAAPVATTEPIPKPTAVPAPTPLALPTAVPVTEFTISFSGDILSHTPVIARAQANGNEVLAFDYRPMFDAVRSRLTSADIAICVLETPLSPDNSDLDGYPAFNAPGDLADALIDAGFDGCATASNHSFDRGVTGITNTLDELDRVSLNHAGMARTVDEYESERFYRIGDATIAHLSFTYGLNGFVLPQDQPWLVDVTDPEAVLAKAAKARDAGADIVVLMLQWGNEYVTDPTAEQRALAERFTASPDIDLIVGNHAHVVQPIGRVNDKLVVYGLGNFLSNQPAPGYPARTQDGMIVEVTFAGRPADGWDLDRVAVVPTWVDKATYTILPVKQTLNDASIAADLRSVLETSFARTTDAVSRLDADITFE